MSNDTSVERFSFTATCELRVGQTTYPVAQAGPDFLELKSAADVPSGPAELVIQYSDRPGPIHRRIEVLGSADSKRRLSIQR